MWPAVQQQLRDAPALILLLDYDGTLVDFRPLPQEATPDHALRALLQQLATLPDTNVQIVSGRRKEELSLWFSSLPVGIHAEHGLLSQVAPAQPWQKNLHTHSTWKSTLRKRLRTILEAHPHALLEEKEASLSFHYRAVPPAQQESCKHEALRRAATFCKKHNLQLLSGNKVIEMRPLGLHKGLVISRLQSVFPHALFLALGDDPTDEDLFRHLPPESIAIKVGNGPSIAPYRLPDFRATRAFLQELIRLRSHAAFDESSHHTPGNETSEAAPPRTSDTAPAAPSSEDFSQ